MKKNSLSVIVLTFNEEVNLPRCLESVKGIADDVYVVDSYSTDETLDIARKYGAEVFQHPFIHQADQMNWALQNLPLKTEWVLRIDADEYLLPELVKELPGALEHAGADVNGFYLKRRVVFMGRWIKHGGYYPTWIVRVWRNGKAVCEQRAMDEHMVLTEGRAEQMTNDFVDDNRKSLEEWTAKHNRFSTREAHERMKPTPPEVLTGQAGRKRWMKNNFYMKLPAFFRAMAYFLYRFLFLGGFLDGTEGLVFHFLQGFWHQFLIDAKMYEARKK